MQFPLLPSYAGTVFSLVGSVMLDTVVVDTPVMVRGTWRRADSQELSASSEDSTPPFSTLLTFGPLIGAFGGEYEYFVSVEPSDTTFFLPTMASRASHWLSSLTHPWRSSVPLRVVTV